MNKELQKRILSSLILIPVSLYFIIKGSFLFNFYSINFISMPPKKGVQIEKEISLED